MTGMYLDKKLYDYSKQNIYPFHMPGHKRRWDLPKGESIDITEIEGFDDLHHSCGILKEAQQRAALAYGSKACFYTVNGSTAGILAAIWAALGENDELLTARNVHRSVYNAALIRHLRVISLYPSVLKYGLSGGVDADDVRKAFDENPGIKAFILTSPTYEGIVSDIAAIAEAVHERGAFLIVDEAHGAHFGFHEGFPETAVRLGADIVIQSMHKTLPCYTQSALIHCNRQELFEQIKEALGIFETSSPSYVMMAAMDACIRQITADTGCFERFKNRLDAFYARCKNLRCMELLDGDASEMRIFGQDKSRLVISSRVSGISGKTIMDMLLHEYGIQMEMAQGSYVVGISTIADTDEGFERLWQALEDMDKAMGISCGAEPERFSWSIEKYEKLMEIYEAKSIKCKNIPLKEASGAVSGDFIYLYPPGIPVIVPGERITDGFIRDISGCMAAGLDVRGVLKNNEIRVLDHHW